jgi:hypothetical protein
MSGKCIVLTAHRLGFGVRLSYRLQVAVAVAQEGKAELWIIGEMLSALRSGPAGGHIYWTNKREAFAAIERMRAADQLPYQLAPGLWRERAVEPLERVE